MTEVEWLDIFGDNLKSMLEHANMTQMELAEYSGLSKAAISRYINKERIPSLRAIINISYALECDVGELIDFNEPIY